MSSPVGILPCLPELYQLSVEHDRLIGFSPGNYIASLTPRLTGRMVLAVLCEAECCVPGTARILKGVMSLPFIFKLIKSQTQPGEQEAGWSATETRARGESERSERQRYSGMATGYPATVPGKEAALLRQGTANARGDVQESSLGGFGGTSLQHKVKSSIHYRPNRYTRRSCAQRCVFTPGDLP